MHKIARLGGLLLVWLVYSLPAQTAWAQTAAYAGFKLSYFELTDPALTGQRFDDPDNAGLLLGYAWQYPFDHLGGEAELTRTFVKGSLDGQPSSADTYGAYLVYRTRESARINSGPYLKFKAGAFHYRAEIGDSKESDTTGAVGIGFGVNMYLVRFELEILAPQKDVGFVSLNIVF
ncbi:MAG: outer membrane beta-barrel protein [Gammaproteobacteria bacterium]|nr:outer membrane beta-barrel protein [Gammaproteobacteria bacterium]